MTETEKTDLEKKQERAALMRQKCAEKKKRKQEIKLQRADNIRRINARKKAEAEEEVATDTETATETDSESARPTDPRPPNPPPSPADKPEADNKQVGGDETSAGSKKETVAAAGLKDDSAAATSETPENPYLALRKAKMARNEAMFRQLGLDEKLKAYNPESEEAATSDTPEQRPVPPLPAGWKEYTDDTSGKSFYAFEDGTSQWERPGQKTKAAAPVEVTSPKAPAKTLASLPTAAGRVKLAGVKRKEAPDVAGGSKEAPVGVGTESGPPPLQPSVDAEDQPTYGDLMKIIRQQQQQMEQLMAQQQKPPATRTGKKKKRKAGDRPTTIRQQMDERVREKLQGVISPMKMTQKMSIPLTRSDDYIAVDPSAEDDLAISQARWPETIHGLFCATNQTLNEDGNNAGSGDFRSKRVLLMNVGSEHMKEVMMQADLNSLERIITVDGQDYMNHFQSESAKKKAAVARAKMAREGKAKREREALKRAMQRIEEEGEDDDEDDDDEDEDEQKGVI